jgi:hypothetical protein
LSVVPSSSCSILLNPGFVGIVLPILLVYPNCLSVNNESASLQPDPVSKSVGE